MRLSGIALTLKSVAKDLMICIVWIEECTMLY